MTVTSQCVDRGSLCNVLIDGGYTQCTPAWSRPDGYYAHHYRFYALVAGVATIRIGPQQWTIRSGACFFIPGYRKVGFFCTARLDVFWLHFRTEHMEFEALLSQISEVRMLSALFHFRWREVWTQISHYTRTRAPSLALRLQAMLMDMTAELIGGSLDDPKQEQASASLRRLQPALELMDRMYLQNPSLAEIASSAGLSPTYFHAQFVRWFHVTPHQYMLRRRMRMARQLLAEGELPIYAVAEQCGYPNVFYFSRAFRKFYGQPPSSARGVALMEP